MVRRILAASFSVAACASPAPTGTAPPVAIAAPSSVPATVDAGTAPSGKARIDLGVRKPSYLLGENVLVDFCVVNTTGAPLTIEVGGDYRGSSRSLRFKVEVRDKSGAVMPDPDPNPMNFGGLGYSPKIEPGDKWC